MFLNKKINQSINQSISQSYQQSKNIMYCEEIMKQYGLQILHLK